MRTLHARRIAITGMLLCITPISLAFSPQISAFRRISLVDFGTCPHLPTSAHLHGRRVHIHADRFQSLEMRTSRRGDRQEARSGLPPSLLGKLRTTIVPLKSGSGNTNIGNTRDDLHIERKLFHILGGVIFAVIRTLVSKSVYVFYMGILAALILMFETLRLQLPAINGIISGTFSSVMRKHEAHQFSGMAYYFAGVTLTCYLYHQTIAVIGILSLAIGDPTASFTGQLARKVLPPNSLFSKKLLPGKSVAGTLGFVVSTAALNALLLTTCATGTLSVPIILSLILAPAICGGLVELVTPSPQICLPLKRFPLGLDDNFLLPVLAATGCHVAWILLGSPPLPVLRPLLPVP